MLALYRCKLSYPCNDFCSNHDLYNAPGKDKYFLCQCTCILSWSSVVDLLLRIARNGQYPKAIRMYISDLLLHRNANCTLHSKWHPYKQPWPPRTTERTRYPTPRTPMFSVCCRRIHLLARMLACSRLRMAWLACCCWPPRALRIPSTSCRRANGAVWHCGTTSIITSD